MSVIPTKPGDRMAASAWESRKADQNAGAGNAFAELFGTAWTQQMQQTRAAQDQRMLLDNGGAIAETSRRAQDGATSEQAISARMPSREPQRASDVQRSDERSPEQTAEQTRATENPQARSNSTTGKTEADNAGSDAALAKRLARQQRPASQNGQTAQMPQSSQKSGARAGSSAIADDAADALTAAAKGKGKRSAAADGSSGIAGADGADGSLAKTLGNDAVQTQRAVAAAEATGRADAAVSATAGTLPDSATDANNQAESKGDLLAASARASAVPADMQAAGTATRSGNIGAADTAASAAKVSATTLQSSTDAATQASTLPSSMAGSQNVAKGASDNSIDSTAKGKRADPTAASDDAQTAAGKLRNLRAPGDATMAASAAGNSKDAAVRMVSAADLTQVAAGVNTSTSGNNAASLADALRQRAGTAETTLPQVKTIDPRDASATSLQAASTGITAAKSTSDSVTGAAAANSASTLPAGNAGEATRKAEETRPAQGARSRTGGGIGTVGVTAGTSASSTLSAVATDTRAAVEQAAAAAANNNPQGNAAQVGGSLQGMAGNSPLAAQSAAERFSDSASSTSGAMPGNGSQLTAAALDGLNAFQRVAAQDDAPRLVMSTPITEPGFADELYDTVKLVSTRGLQSVEINIAPAELGPIKLRVDMTGNEAEVRFEAAHETTRNLLADAVPALKEQLAQSGIDLRHASIDRNNAWSGNPQNLSQNLGQGAGQSGNSGGQQSGQSGRSSAGQIEGNAGNGRGDGGISQPAQRLRNALLDTYA